MAFSKERPSECCSDLDLKPENRLLCKDYMFDTWCQKPYNKQQQQMYQTVYHNWLYINCRKSQPIFPSNSTSTPRTSSAASFGGAGSGFSNSRWDVTRWSVTIRVKLKHFGGHRPRHLTFQLQHEGASAKRE